jgi:nucleoside-diphosphate-sugar epimerase
LKALVTGGGGFLGRAVVETLLAEGHEVSTASRGTYPELEAQGVRCLRADLRDADALESAVAGHDTVFHVAALTGVWGARKDYHDTNVLGTRNVVEACRRGGVERLIATSSPSVCFDGSDHVRAKNDLPHARSFLCAYPETKAEAEAEVLAANGAGLATCALRPHLIFGPRDPHLIPRLLGRARAGRLRVVGDGANEVSLCYVDNAAAAHLDAARSLAPDAAHAGKAYFIAQEEPVKLWDWISGLLERVGVEPVRKRVPLGVAYGAGALLEAAWKLLSLKGEPPMTRFVAAQLASSHSYDMGPAQRDFGYVERVGLEEATVRLVEWLLATEGGSRV